MSTNTPTRHRHRGAAVLVLAAGLVAGMVSAQAATYLETFDGPLDPNVWLLGTGGNDYDVVGGELVFRRLTGNVSHLRFVPQLIGDFDVGFEYRLIDWVGTYASGDRLQLDVSNPLPSPRAHAVGRAQEGLDGSNYHFGAVDSACCTFGAPVRNDAGALRITRVDGAVSVWYHDGDSWQALGQSAPDHRDMTLSLTSYVHNAFVPGTSYAIDNVSIWAAAFSQPVPEPAAGAMLLAGLATLGWMARRRRPAG